jgi:hypothetical protein
MNKAQKSKQVSRSSPTSNYCKPNWAPEASGIDLEILAGGVGLLRLKMERIGATECGHCKALINLAFAEREARAGNQTRAVNHLKKAGKPALDLATKMGISVISDVVRGWSRS